jgi:hypothetical protein
MPTLLTDYADLIVEHAVEDGAIVMYDPYAPPFSVDPYFANLACIGLVNAYTKNTDHPQYLSVATDWVTWYIDYANRTNGVICDYVGVSANWSPSTTNPPYDSADAYIATFLSLAGLVYPHADSAWQKALSGFLPTALSVVDQVLQKSVAGFPQKPTADLTTQYKESAPVPLFCYTEDNCEVYSGLVAAAALGASIPSLNPGEQAANTLAAIDKKLFATGAPPFPRYDLAAAVDGQTTATSNVQSVFYPDQQVQLLALSQLPPDAKRAALYADMKSHCYSQLPAVIANSDATKELNNLDQIVWWGLAAMRMEGPQPNQTMIDIYSRLAAYNPGIGSWVHDIGHACTILAAYVPPPPAPPHRHGPQIRPSARARV